MTERTRIWVALWAVYIIWGSTYLFIRIAGDTLPLLLAVSTRFIGAGAIMTAIVIGRGGSMRVSRRELGSCALIACLLPVANGVLFYAERDVTTGLASLLIASVPLWVVVQRFALRDPQPLTAIAGVAVGFAGVAVLAQPGTDATATGIGLCVLSSVMWAVGSVASSRITLPANPLTATAWEMLIGGFVMLPFGLATTHSFSPSAASLGAWLYLVTIGSVIGYTAYTWLLSNAPIGLVSTYAYVNPVVAIILGVLFLGEGVSWRLLLGAAIVVSAVAVVLRRDAPAATIPEEGIPR